ncbi:Estrogen sulfotransferase, partial [Araneus ventricosus]
MSASNFEKDQKTETPRYQDVDGFRIIGMFPAEAFKSALAYKPRPDDLFIVTYPKCGTTWIHSIVTCIFREGRPFSSAIEFFMDVPLLQLTGAEAAEKAKRPAAIKFHLPFHLTPWSPEAKCIFVARNPKDCCVSFFHHTVNALGYRFADGKFDDYFELFINGEVDYGDYFDTTLSLWKHRNDPNVLFITYEELKEDTIKNVLKIAGFIGSEHR